MPNSFTNLVPVLVAQGLQTLRAACVMPRLVNTDYSNDPANQGDTVNLWIPSAATVSDVTPSATPVTPADSAPVRAPIALSQWRKSGFHLTDKQRMEIISGFPSKQAQECIKVIAEDINSYILGKIFKIYNVVGTAGVTPFATDISTATAARKYLNLTRTPLTDRRLVLGPDAEANALGLAVLTTFQNQGDAQAIKEGMITRRLGFDWYMDQQIPTQATSTPTAGAITANGVNALNAGTTDGGRTGTISIAKATNATNLIAGDRFNIAGDSTNYVVLTAVTLAVGNTTVSIAPALQKATVGAEVITFRTAHVANLAFHRDTFGFVSRPLQASNANTIEAMSVADPVSGITLRLEVIRQNKQDYYEFDVLYGADCVRPELGCIIAG
jgi:hypothetical protein